MKLKQLLALLLALAMVLALSACKRQGQDGPSESGSEPEPEAIIDYPVTVGDAILSEQPTRVVSLSPALTEIMAEMGYAGQLVGISDYCDTPQTVTDLPRCGTPQQINFDALGKVNPQLVVTSTPLIESELIRLQQRDIQVLVLPRANTIDELRTLYVNLARALEGDTTGREAGETYFDSFTKLMDVLGDLGKAYMTEKGAKPNVVMIRMLDYTVATGDTFEGRLLEAIGLKNLASGYGQWLFPKEDAAALTPDLIIAHTPITIPVLEKNQVYKKTQAVIKDRVINVDMIAFERQSPRMFDELERIALFAYEGVSASQPQSGSQSSSGSTIE